MHIALVDSLDSYLSASQLVNGKCNLTKGSFTDPLNEVVKFLDCGRNLLVLLQVEFIVADQSFALLQN